MRESQFDTLRRSAVKAHVVYGRVRDWLGL
jgi:hypothetical protein